MTDEKWTDLIEKLSQSPGILERGKEDLPHGPGFREFVVVKPASPPPAGRAGAGGSPRGKVRLERWSHPRVTGKTVHAPKRIGGSVSVQYQYAQDEWVHTLKAFEEREGEWREIEAPEGL